MMPSDPQMAMCHATGDDLLRVPGDRRHCASFDAYVVQETRERTRDATAARQATAR
jgi:hypothetical protein